MRYRVKIKSGKRTVYSHSYPSLYKAKKAKKRTRGATGVVRS